MSRSARLLSPLLVSLVTLLFACSEPPAAQEARGLVIVNSENPDRPYFHDFGDVAYGDVLEHTFELLNTDPVPVTIRDLLPSCGCTGPEIRAVSATGEEIVGNVRNRDEVIVLPPGARAFVRMKLDTKEVEKPNYDKLAMVRLRSNSRNNAFINFEMHLVVRLFFQCTPKQLDLGQVPESAGGSGFVEIANADTKRLAKVLSVEEHDPALDVSLTHSVRFGVDLWTLTAKVPPGMNRGPHVSEIVLRTTDGQGQGDSFLYRVPLRAQVVTDIVTEPATAALGSFDRETGRTFEARLRTLVPGHRIAVSGFELDGSGSEELEVEYSPVSPDDDNRAKEWIVALRVPAGASEDVYSGSVILKLDDPQYTTVRLPYSGRVTP